jgi:hypothetical protein
MNDGFRGLNALILANVNSVNRTKNLTGFAFTG